VFHRPTFEHPQDSWSDAHKDDRNAAHYTSGQGSEYFGWPDATHDTVQQLAERFSERYSEIVRFSFGDDWSYAGWYVRMLGYAERGLFPIAYVEWNDPPNPDYLPLLGAESDLPMPLARPTMKSACHDQSERRE
jgi:hypothetical protein